MLKIQNYWLLFLVIQTLLFGAQAGEAAGQQVGPREGESGYCTQTLQGHTGCVWSVTYSPDGTHLASGLSDKTIKVLNLMPYYKLKPDLKVTAAVKAFFGRAV